MPQGAPADAGEAVPELRAPTREVRGRVKGGVGDLDVWAYDEHGDVVARGHADASGEFVVAAPLVKLRWTAVVGMMRMSESVERAADDASDVELLLLPGGRVDVALRDPDTGQPLTARLVVHGVAPTADPSFGPDYRASGAGPLLDVLRGETTLTLPSGRYRLVATRGIEYTTDEATIDVPPGAHPSVVLSLRHAVPTPDLVGCDFHVHARPSFDAPVTAEDRVLSLVAAGVEFAVPSEHNLVGDYRPALDATKLEGELASVRGVEVTTFAPRRGHFNVFPYDAEEPPPYERTSIAKMVAVARGGDARRYLQVNHPRMNDGIGYFDVIALDPKRLVASRGELVTDFDGIEVYNGGEAAEPAKVERVFDEWLTLLEAGKRWVATGSSDSHRIQYQWAGYPRTYVRMVGASSEPRGLAIDGVALVASLKEGHAMATSGPIVEARIGEAGPGDVAHVEGGTARVHVRVRAVPWVDVRQIEVRVGAKTAATAEIEERPLVTSAPSEPLAAVEAAALRFEGDFDVAVPARGGFVVVVVRGERKLDDVLPFMPIRPFAFTNPIWLR